MAQADLASEVPSVPSFTAIRCAPAVPFVPGTNRLESLRLGMCSSPGEIAGDVVRFRALPLRKGLPFFDGAHLREL